MPIYIIGSNVRNFSFSAGFFAIFAKKFLKSAKAAPYNRSGILSVLCEIFIEVGRRDTESVIAGVRISKLARFGNKICI